MAGVSGFGDASNRERHFGSRGLMCYINLRLIVGKEMHLVNTTLLENGYLFFDRSHLLELGDNRATSHLR